jgi:ABC-2 type transport system ATP-binding protein
MVQFNGVSFAYRKTPVFENVSLSISPGYLYGILGRNGTGKSTLLYLLSGLLRPTRGASTVMGYKPHERQPAFLQKVFMIPEEFHMPDISLDNFVKYHGQFYPLFNRELFLENLDAFEVPSHTLLKMSYGQKKKVLVSFALATGVPLLLMDEPTNGLDVISKSQFRKVIAKSLRSDNTIVISSHQVSDLSSLIDHLIVLDSTKITVQSSIQDIESRLVFKVTSETLEDEHVLYSELSRGGKAMVAINDGSEESRIDLELFYKAAMNNPAGVAYALNN